MHRLSPTSPWSTLLATIGSMVASLLIFYRAPVVHEKVDGSPVEGLVLFTLGLAALLALLAVQVRRQVRARHDLTVRVQSIFGLISPFICFFAYIYYALQISDATAFVGMSTRTDALYFTVVTLGTVGYGDIHPVGEYAKLVTMVQIILDLVLIGALVNVVTARLRDRAELRRAAQTPATLSSPSPDTDPGADQRGEPSPGHRSH